MPLLDRQKREAQIGVIRVGTSTKAARGRKPVRLDRFRFTSRSEVAIRQIAELFGGEPRPWVDGAPTTGQFEVISHRNEIAVATPPGGMLTQDYELWVKGSRQRLCDSQTERLTEPRPCPCAAEERRVCKPKSRLRVILPDVPGGGTWGLSTVSGNAADELAGVAETLDKLALRGVTLPAVLRLEMRVTFPTPEERVDYPVVVLQMTNSFRELAEIAAGGTSGALMLPPPSREMAAITARRASDATPPAGVSYDVHGPAAAPTPNSVGGKLGDSNEAAPTVGASPADGWVPPRDAEHLAAMVEVCPPSLAWIAEMQDKAARAGWLDAWVASEKYSGDALIRLREVFEHRADEIRSEDGRG